MKAIKYLLGISVIALLTFTGCDNVLDKEPIDAFTNNNFWSGNDNIVQYANTFFNTFTGYGNGTAHGDFYFTNLNDDQVPSDFVDWKGIGKEGSNSTWKNTYAEIKRANIMIEKVEGMGEKLTTTQHNNWIGVARLMRAYHHYNLVKSFGNVQWVDKVVETTDKDILYGKRMDRDQVMDKVLEDLNYACENITAQNAICDWSKDLANAIKSDVCLYEGTFCKYRSTADDQKAPDAARVKKYLEECVKANAVLIGGGRYELEAGIEGYQATYNSLSLLSSKQVIFAKHYAKDILAHSLTSYVFSSTTQHGIGKNGFEAFRKLDGTKATTADNLLVLIPKGGNVPHNFLSIAPSLALRDKRLSAIVDPIIAIKDCGHVRGDDDCDGNSDHVKDKAWKMEMLSSSGLTICKYDNADMETDYRQNNAKNYIDCPLYWYAVILLNDAEAKVELGTITDADLNATVNKLRERGGLPALTKSNYYDEASLLEAIRNDRRCELMCDNDYRYWDLIRWHKLNVLADQSCNIGIYVKANGVALPDDDLKSMDVNADGYLTTKKTYDRVRTWNTKYYLYPIPSSESSLNPQLGQNPGW